MPTEENQNLQTGANPANTGDSGNDPKVSSTDETNLDIDLNLDGIDVDQNVEVTQEEKEESTQETIDASEPSAREKVEEIQVPQEELEFLEPIQEDNKESDAPVEELDIANVGASKEKMEEPKEEVKDEKNTEDDWLAEEDKKVEEQNNGAPQGITGEQLKIDNGELQETVETKQETNLEDLDIPFVEETKVEEEPRLDSSTRSTAVSEGLTSVEDKKVENTEEGLNLDALDVPEVPVEEPKIEENKEEEKAELHTEDLGETVVENKEGDIVSDTGEMNSKPDGYVPNEHDFNQTIDALNSTDKGEVSLDDLEKNTDENKNLKEGVVATETKEEGALDLDSMIANFEQNQPEAPVVQPEVKEEKPLEVQQNPVENVEPAVNNIDLGSTEPVVATEAPVVEQNVQVTEEQPQQVSNENIVAPGSVVLDEAPKIKNKHSGLKIFLLIILLLVGGVMVLSRMYPEEFGDIMSAIKGEDTTVIEYSDNAEMDTVLEETEEVVSVDTGIVEEEPDPDSLAGQLEGDASTGTDNMIEYESDTQDTGHNATEDDFNAFEDLEEIIDPVTSEYAALLESLRDYKMQGDEYNEWGRSQGNTTAMKYGLYISEKSASVINDIETNVEIDNTKVENYFAQFDVYLGKLETLRNSIEGDVQSDDLTEPSNDETTNQSSGTVQEI